MKVGEKVRYVPINYSGGWYPPTVGEVVKIVDDCGKIQIKWSNNTWGVSTETPKNYRLVVCQMIIPFGKESI